MRQIPSILKAVLNSLPVDVVDSWSWIPWNDTQAKQRLLDWWPFEAEQVSCVVGG